MRASLIGIAAGLSAACFGPVRALARDSSIASARTHIKHVIVLMLENRSFDHYFGTFPGADGLPSGVCLPWNLAEPGAGCLVPYHEPGDSPLWRPARRHWAAGRHR